ncbi:MAG: phage integrase N-terminal SAM-like domain-containing protein [Gammaproteobacteria bacterium]|nr:phage integrase N-terminal SAM-like domain-containing protein [Gammaproteobacteria bacterium]MCF6261365.1 phage integrase N-terminal SAM-like domain-containing protein [Gammaproteobacteria bacterium]
MDSAVSSSPFLRSVVEAICVRHYSIRTEKAYINWIKRFILFHDKRHPAKMGGVEVGDFLTDLAMNRQVSPSTQNQGLNALNFLYKVVLEQPLGDVKNLVRAKNKRKLPVVLTVDEVRAAVLRELNGVQWLAACLMYGSGLRLMECLRLRVMNLDFLHRAVYVRIW